MTHTKRELQANITDEHIYKTPQQNSSKQNPATHLKDQVTLFMIVIKWTLFQGYKDSSIYANQSM